MAEEMAWRRNLARIYDRRLEEVIVASRLPAVDLAYTRRAHGLPTVMIDNRNIVDLGLGHLLDRGFANVAFCGVLRGANTRIDERCDLFVESAHRTGRKCFVFPAHVARDRRASWEAEQERLVRWVSDLPKPVGVMACFDDRGYQLLEACRRAQVVVPEQVAVIGVDNDELLCNLSTPPLSSVDLDAKRAGYEAARLLDSLMHGESAPTAPILLPASHVVARQSTDIMAVADPDLARIIRFIRDNACRGIRVADALNQSKLSHSTMERRFRSLLGRPPKAEIIRVQLGRAKQLLTESDMSVSEIAYAVGFPEPKHLSEIFHRKEGMSPSEFRRLSRNGPAAKSQKRLE